MDISNAQESSQTEESSHPRTLAIDPEHKLGQSGEVATENSSLKQLGDLSEDLGMNCVTELPVSPPRDAIHNHRPFSPLGQKSAKNTAKSVKKALTQRSSVGTARVLRSRSQEKPTTAEPAINTTSNSSKRKQKTTKKKLGEKSQDEFSKARKRLGYLLHRISYEQNFIDVYSGEGWKGQSLEKIKPEKELQRARDEIFRCKLKIRDLFRHVDSLCSEGRLPDSLFDSEGQIDSEDIFCAKCQSDNVTANNDIILCDGACERGFHQLCLEPPLITVPQGDDGWLCPGCDCKDDCVDLLNDSQGTNLTIEDNWEKVFPEAASAAAAANDKNQSCGLSSDDSDDDDYNPDVPDVDDEMVQGDDLGSSETESISASSDMEVSHNDEQLLGLPSDDSEDDDYDPDVLDCDEQNKMENSSSDFSSDSEDLDATLKEAEEVDNLSGDSSKHSKLSDVQKSEHIGSRCPRGEDLLPMLELDPGKDSAPLSGKRLVERLDYKKLYDETYGGTSSDSSDDEDWIDPEVLYGVNRSNEEVLLSSPCGDSPINKNGNNRNWGKLHLEVDHRSSRRRIRQKLNIEGANDSTALSDEVSPGRASSGTRVKKQASKRLGEIVTQGLSKYFNENQYPDRSKKQELGKEFGITAQQVSKWFENARWSFNHPSAMGTGKNTPKLKPIPMSENLPEPEAAIGSESSGAIAAPTEHCGNGREDSSFNTKERSKQHKSRSNFKRKASDQTSDANAEAPKSLASSADARGPGNSSAKKRNRSTV